MPKHILVVAITLLTVRAGAAHAQSVAIPLTPARWTATDSIRFEDYLGRPSLYMNKGVALAAGVTLRNGSVEFDMAASPRTNFMGLSFHATDPLNSEVVFFRVGSSGTAEAIQYAPALNGVAAAWQVYHGDGANASVALARETWTHVRIDLSDDSASVYVGDATKPALVIPRLAGVAGGSLGFWGGAFGRGAHYSNVRYTIDPSPAVRRPPPALRGGTIADWQLSQSFDASTLTPGVLPNLATLHWDAVHPEPEGFVLVNRYRVMPAAGLPNDSAGQPLVDSIMGGRVPGSKVVFARAVVNADRAAVRRMHFAYSDGVIIFCNGRPLYFGMNAPFFRDLGVMDRYGDAVYLPLERGRNEIVFAVTEYSGGWAFMARLDP